MSFPHIGWEALVLGIPAVGAVTSAFFHLDVLLAKPKSNSGSEHHLSHTAEDGNLVCVEPDGRSSVVVAGPARGLATWKASAVARRGGPGAVRRVRAEWVEESREE